MQNDKITPESVIPNVHDENYDSLKSFYDSIPYEGSLGLLALGAVGILAWRKKRQEIDKKSNQGGDV